MLSGQHAGGLRLLEVRDHVNRVERNHRHELRARLDIFADLRLTVADNAIDWRTHNRVLQILLRKLEIGLGLCERREQLATAFGDDIDLLLTGGVARAALLGLRRGTDGGRARLIGV